MNSNNKIKSIIKDFKDGKTANAILQLKDLIKNNPENLDYLFLYAKMCNQLNSLNEAEKALLFLISKNKTSIEYLHNLYSIYLKKNNITKSEIFIKQLLEIDKNHYEAKRDLAFIEYTKNNINVAQTILEKIVDDKNNDPFALNVLGLVFLKNELIDKAQNLFDRAITVNPKYIDSYNNLGKTFFDLEDLDKAFVLFKKAYKINQKFSKTLINIGNYLSLKDKNLFAIKAYEKALLYEPKNTEIFSNISIAYARIKDFNKAKKYYDKAIINNSLSPSLDLSLFYLYIYKNQYDKAWTLFESRKGTPKFLKSKNKSIIKQTLKAEKETILNKKILVLREQGIGEEILFSSMYKELINLNNNIKIETDERLINIFERSFESNKFVRDGFYSKNKEELKNFDSIIFAGSLCNYFRKNKKDFLKKSYLVDNYSKTMKIKDDPIFKNNDLKIGLSWKSVVSVYGRLKSLNLSDFKPLIKNNRRFINLQYGEVKEEIKKTENNNFNMYSFEKINLFNDLDDLMSILKNLDIFVTVSNSTAHLAAAMGVKTLLICPKISSTYFYWSNENNITPWYKNVQIFQIDRSIKETIENINKVLNKL
jgi:tetratricopeptide (TPR) repeat protein